MLGKNIRKMRRDRELSQEKLGEVLGVNRRTVRQWEAGRNMPRAETLERVAEYFGTTSRELMED